MRLLAIAIASILSFVVPATALGDVTADFEGFPPGTAITNQYADLGGAGQGVTFGPLPGAAGDGFRPVVKDAPVGQPQSGSHIAGIFECNTSCAGFEFFPPTTTGTFQSGRLRVSVRVGLDASSSAPSTNVSLQAYNANGDPVGTPSSAAVSAGAGYHTLLSVEMATPVIRGFRITGSDNNLPVGIDDVTFDVPATPPPRDFTLTPASTFLVMSQGQTINDTITIARSGGSSGDIEFSLSGPLPSGVHATFTPNPADGGSTVLTLTADPGSATTGFNPITLTVTGNPRPATAGSEPRSFPIQLQVRSAFDMTIGGPTNVDLGECVARIPVQIRRDFGFAGPVSLAVSGLTGGIGASFEPAQITFPNGAGAQTSDLVVTGPSTGLPVPPTQLTVTASAPGHPPRSGQVTVSGTCPAQYDARVTSLEVTQGTQSEVLPQRFTENPAAPIAYSEIPGTADLRRGAPTVVRVYANLLFGPPGGAPNVPMVLYGERYDRFGQAKPLPRSPIAPISPPRKLDVGPELPPATEVASETAVYTFMLPDDWNQQQFGIGASLQPSLGGGPRAVKPCETAVCKQNDNMAISRIPLVAARQVTVNPLELTVSGAAQPAPEAVFKWARMMAPIDVRIKPYATTIDITDVSDRLAACRAAAPPGDPGRDARRKCSDQANSGASGRVKDYTCDTGGHEREWNIGVNTGVARGLKSSHWCWLEGRVEDDAVVERMRPMTSVAHEFGHLLARPHADRLCGGNSDGQEGEAWPPDDMGFLQSVGLSTDVGTGINGGPFAVMAPPKQWFDYMSYCASSASTSNPVSTGDAWISVRNWNRILSRFDLRRPVAKPVRLAQGPRQRSLHVSALANDLGVTIDTVEPVDAPAQPPSDSGYRLRAFDAGGAQLVEVAMVETSAHVDGEPPAVTLDGVVPAAGVARIAIVRDGVTLAERAQSANAPEVSFTGIPSFRRGRATVRWRASDADRDALLATLDYSADGGRTFERIWTGPNRSGVRLPARLLPRTSRARLRVTVNDGFRASSAKSRTFASPGAAPLVDVVSPPSGMRQPNDAPLALTGRAFDDRSRALTGRRLRWLLRGRRIGTGERISPAGLPAGRHRIVLEARDSAGRVSRDSVTVTLTQAKPLFLTLSAPVTVKRTARSLRLRIAVSQPSQLIVSGAGGRAQRFAVDRKARRLTVRLRRGTKPLTLRLTLEAGRQTNLRTVTVARR